MSAAPVQLLKLLLSRTKTTVVIKKEEEKAVE